MSEITEPLRLAVGSHVAGSGKGCAMNVISWENGDTTITDLPACSNPTLSRMVQWVNDYICTHRTTDLLCPSCSVEVLALAHRSVGTARHGEAFQFDPALVEALNRASDAINHTYTSAAVLALAHRAFDRFEEWTGHVAPTVSPEITEQAVACMLQTA